MERTVIRRRLRLFGYVQGVGLRYLARHAADAYGATGWVRNEPDGSVTMELQGTCAQLDAVLSGIERGHYVRIEAIDERAIPVLQSERGFHTLG